MTSQEKAKELVDKFSRVGLQQREAGIVCAIMCVVEIVEAIKNQPYTLHQYSEIVYWNSVRIEINNL